MKLINKPGTQEIGSTIRAVAAAESHRYFKSETNSPERSSWVFGLIQSCVALALFDLGVGTAKIMYDVDSTDIVVEQMRKDGYAW